MEEAMNINVSSMPINRLIKDFSRGYIGIPEFQREYVWKDGKVLKLIDSIYNKYPIGTLLIWQPPSTANVKSRNRKHPEPIKWLIDGQQRTLSLASALDDGSVSIYFNPIRGDFKLASRSIINNDDYVKLVDILQNNKYFKIKKEFTDRHYEEIESIETNFDRCRRILDEDIPIVMMENHNNEKAVEVFKRINTSGTRLSGGDIQSAELSFHHVGFVQEFVQPTLKWLRNQNFDRVYSSHLFAACNAILKKGPHDKQPSIFKVDQTHLKAAWSKLRRGLEWTIDLLKNELQVTDMKMLWSGAMLMPIVVLHAKLKPSNLSKGKIFQWLLLSSIRHRYARSTHTVLQFDLKLCLYNKPIEKLLAEIKNNGGLKAKPNDFRGSYTERSALLGLYVSILNNKGLDLYTGTKINYRSYSKIDKHHIFPQSLFPKESKHLANVIGNIALITSDTNKEITNNSQENYLESIKPIRLRSQLIPTDKKCWEQNRYGLFVKNRTKQICDSFNCFLKNHIKT